MGSREIQKKLNKSTTDVMRVGNYMKMFDRILLYNIAVNSMPPEALQETLNIWEKVIKRGINEESASRSEFLESSRQGRKAKYRSEPDGEDLLLNLLEQYEIAKEVIQSNLKKPFETDDDDEEEDYDEDYEED